jgi:hypothetical protein
MLTSIFTLSETAKITPKFLFSKDGHKLTGNKDYTVSKKDSTQSANILLLKINFFGESLQCL